MRLNQIHIEPILSGCRVCPRGTFQNSSGLRVYVLLCLEDDPTHPNLRVQLIHAVVERVQLEGSLAVLAPGHAQTVDRELLALQVHQAAAIVPPTGMLHPDQVPAEDAPASPTYAELIQIATISPLKLPYDNVPNFALEALTYTNLVIVELVPQERNRNQIDSDV